MKRSINKTILIFASVFGSFAIIFSLFLILLPIEVTTTKTIQVTSRNDVILLIPANELQNYDDKKTLSGNIDNIELLFNIFSISINENDPSIYELILTTRSNLDFIHGTILPFNIVLSSVKLWEYLFLL